MNSIVNSSMPSHANVFERSLSLAALRERAPAVFASSADERVSRRYTFIETSRVVEGLMSAGFVPVEARQAHTRTLSPLHARHVVRFRRSYESVSLADLSIPEVILVNDHSGAGSYFLRLGIYRVVCCNGLIVSRGAFPAYCVSHRGDVVSEVISHALELSGQFDALAERVERMGRRRMFKDEQLAFAGKALALRFADAADSGMEPAQLLSCRRSEDTGDDLWTCLNKVEESLLGGGLRRRSAGGRLLRTRKVRSIREDVRLHSGLWDLAEQFLAGA